MGKGEQIEISFAPGLTQQFPTFQDCVKASVYDCGRAFKTIAADLDMSASELSRKLADNPNDPVHFPVHRLPDLIRATGDVRPLNWLNETFFENAEAKQRRALEELATLARGLPDLLKRAGVKV